MSDTSIIKATYSAASAALQNAKTAYNSTNSNYLKLLAEDASGDSTGKYASLNQAGKSKVGSYHCRNSIPYQAIQYCVPFESGYLISYPDGHDTIYARFNSSLVNLDYMRVTSGGHGSSFGLDSSNNIWASTHNNSGGYSIIKFPYSAGKTIDGKSQTPIVSFSDMVRVNYDATKDYIGYTEAYNYNVVAASNPKKILYSIDLSTKGYDPTNQTWQSQSLLFPYVYWHTGSFSEADPATVSCVNLETNELQFSTNYALSGFGMKNAYSEAEGVFAYESLGSTMLVVTFNNHNADSSSQIEYVFNVPVVIANQDLSTALAALNAAKKALADATKAYNSAKSDEEKYSKTNKTVSKLKTKVRKETEDVKSTKSKISSLHKTIAALKIKAKKATGRKLASIKSQITNSEKSLKAYKRKETRQAATLKTSKASLSKSKKSATTAEKNEQRKILKQLIQSKILDATDGAETCYITPVNPGSKDSYVIISPDSLDPEGSSDVGQYPQIKGTPINDVSQTGSSTVSISGTINGKVGADKSAIQKRYDKLKRWFDQQIELQYSGIVASTHAIITSLGSPYDKSHENMIPVSLTLTFTRWADSNLAKAKKTTKHTGKKTKTAGSGKKKSNKTYVTIKKGDTYWKLSRKYNVSVSQLKKWNTQKATNLQVGSKVRVA